MIDKTLTIGIDGNEANVENRVGVNTYAWELLKSLQKLQENKKESFRLIVYLKSEPLNHMPNETQNFSYKVIKGSYNWILTKLVPSLFLDSPKPNVFFSPSHYVPPLSPIPRACSIMDLGYLEHMGQFKITDFWQLKLWTAISIYVSKCIFAISESTRDEIVRHYTLSKRKIQVTMLGYDNLKFNSAISEKDVRRVKTKYSIVSDYILYLGTLKPSKNLENLLSAFYILKHGKLISDKDSDKVRKIKLVIAGKKGWLYKSIFVKVKELGLQNEIIFTDFVKENNKPALIKGAKVFCLPSIWEGFGLDVLSAMACGVPVVVSNVGSLPEVVGSAGKLVNPYKPESIALGLSEVIMADNKKYNKIIEAGYKQAKMFSWDYTAKDTLKALKYIAK